ncbi:hypothetical protein F5148DRAFT_1291787 [Russula earlei]|uniref:Uncharacterized protein n=1 Tax=Russula earlei TaxID=71964 RepID=A0ACC0TV66_9AGAM|nr:hypothetical protein F5148DRAFT_1291787 [Russula earlei]
MAEQSGLPLGILIAHRKRLSGIVLGIAGVLQTIPSIALLGFLIPLAGIGARPAIIALLLYALLPIIRNTFTGITGVDTAIKEAAKGMGMNAMQLLFKIELPLAMPVILAGIRTATVINVGIATLAAYIAAGGLGEFIFGGISLNNSNMILAGAIPAAALAILLDLLLSVIQRFNIKKLRLAIILLPALTLVLSSFYLLPAAYGGKLLAGFTPEFMGREDGDIGLRKQYGLAIRTVVISDAIMYQAAYDKKLDVISGYTPVVREEVLQQYPELEGSLNKLSGLINDSIMTDLNYRTDHLKQTPEQVAKDFLLANKLWKPSRNGQKGMIRIGSKIFGEQYILSSLYKMLIEGLYRFTDLYPEYTGTGLLVILHASPGEVNAIIQDKDKVYSFVKDRFHTNYHLKWLQPVGFNNAYALMMRREQAEHAYNAVRSRSEAICQPLQKEDYVVQPVVDVSPPKWHLGHTTWFFETFLLKPHAKNYQEYNKEYNYVFNSYYETIGARVIRTDRGNLSRPGVDEIYAYRKYVDNAMNAFLNTKEAEALNELIVLGLNHEQQHQELLYTDIKYILGHNPLFPAYSEVAENNTPATTGNRFITIPAGIYEIGYEGEGFCFDNELNRHKVYLQPYSIATELVTNREYLAFINDGGYADFKYWHAEGLDWVKTNHIQSPLYWHHIEGRWHHYSMNGLQPVNNNDTLAHINFYEAAAFAAWKGMRLPTEFEWEVAATQLNWGSRWEWTDSAYLPYPGFKKAAGAIGEYNGKFMINQMVLRGASVATPPGHSRITYRNFFHPYLRWQYTGLRLVQQD